MLTSREQLMSSECSEHQVLSFAKMLVVWLTNKIYSVLISVLYINMHVLVSPGVKWSLIWINILVTLIVCDLCSLLLKIMLPVCNKQNVVFCFYDRLYIFKGNLSPKKEISSFAWRLEISFFHICKFGSIQLNNQNLFHISHEICFRLGAFSFVPTPFVIG